MSKKTKLLEIIASFDRKIEYHNNKIDDTLKSFEKRIKKLEKILGDAVDISSSEDDTDTDTETISDDTNCISENDNDIHKIKIKSNTQYDHLNDITFEQIMKQLLLKFLHN